MSTRMKWTVKFIAGNPEIFSAVRTVPESPMRRGQALETVSVFERRDWRGWVEDAAGNRIYETTAEQEYQNCLQVAKQRWNAGADEYNQWSELGQDEKDELVVEERGRRSIPGRNESLG